MPLAAENTCTHVHILTVRPIYNIKNNKANLLKLHFDLEFITCVRVGGCAMAHPTEAREQVLRVRSFLLSCGSWGQNSGHSAW